MEPQKKKELIAQYKERKLCGGVYMITNQKNGKRLLAAETNLDGSRNKFDFCVKTNLCSYSKLTADWKKYGGSAFTFEVLDEIEKKEAQELSDFKDDLDQLLSMRIADYPPNLLY